MAKPRVVVLFTTVRSCLIAPYFKFLQHAGIAQLVEQSFCKRFVASSMLASGTSFNVSDPLNAQWCAAGLLIRVSSVRSQVVEPVAIASLYFLIYMGVLYAKTISKESTKTHGRITQMVE